MVMYKKAASKRIERERDWVLLCPPSGSREIWVFLSCMTCFKLTTLQPEKMTYIIIVFSINVLEYYISVT